MSALFLLKSRRKRLSDVTGVCHLQLVVCTRHLPGQSLEAQSAGSVCDAGSSCQPAFRGTLWGLEMRCYISYMGERRRDWKTPSPGSQIANDWFARLPTLILRLLVMPAI